jgi:DNA (cytosine-5)-methyltransferase 1
MDPLSGTVRIKTAASMLGVTAQTVRNWVASGQIPSVRHPLNGYRLFRVKDIEQLLVGSGSVANPRDSGTLSPVGPVLAYSQAEGRGYRAVTLRDGQTVTTEVPSNRTAIEYQERDFERDWLRSPIRPASASGRTRVRIGDIFSGGGIFSLGVDEALRAVGLQPEHAFGIDFDRDAIETFGWNFAESVALHSDITSITSGAVGAHRSLSERDFLRSAGEGVDILVAGPPCQGHSDLNNHTRRDDPKNSLYFSVARMAELLQPSFVLIENVPGVVHDRSFVVQRTAEALDNLGYHISSKLVDMTCIGVPQTRRRFVLVASRKGRVDLDAALALQADDARPVSWAIDDLTDRYSADATYESSASHSTENRRRIDYLFDHELHELPNSERPPCHRDKPHSYVSVYGRMWWDRPAPTITGGFGSTGQGRFVHPLFRRTLTPHEACRLQFVPDFFTFPDGVGRRSMQQIIGNAAPPKLSQTVILGAAIQGVLL